jgi:phospholipase C
MFQSNSGPSFPAHLYLVAGQSPFAAENPVKASGIWGCDSPPGTKVSALNANGKEYVYGFPCFNFPTLADELDQAHLSWRYYAPFKTFQWNAYDAISHIRYSADWNSSIGAGAHFTPIQDFAAGNMASVTWVTPDGLHSDHPGGKGDNGPAWVASLVNAIEQGPHAADTTILITWDDWGGWYDHVSPQQFYLDGLGFRVPLIVVSPHARRGYVSHVDHEFGSILHYIETTFGLASLGQRDAQADDLSDCFDFTQPAHRYRPVRAPALQWANTMELPDDY